MDFVQVFNLQRIAVLTTALAANPPDPELIYEAMKDRIHQPYRRELVNSDSSLTPQGPATHRT
jgi:homoserine kinase